MWPGNPPTPQVPRASAEARTQEDRPPPTSKSSRLQLLIPDNGWDDPQFFSNFLNLLDAFMEKTTTHNT